MTDLSPELAAKLNAIHPFLGYAASVMVLLGIIVNAWNTYRTKKNTDAHAATAKLFAQFEERLNAKAEETLHTAREIVTDFRDSVEFTKNQLMVEMNNLKIVIVKVNQTADSKLSGIPKIQDRLEQVDKRSLDTALKAGLTSEKVEEILSIVRKARGG